MADDYDVVEACVWCWEGQGTSSHHGDDMMQLFGLVGELDCGDRIGVGGIAVSESVDGEGCVA